MEAPEMATVVENAAPVLGLDILDTNPAAGTNIEATITAPIRPAPAPVAAPRWGTGWVTFERFAAEVGIGKPQRTIIGNTSRYTIPTRNGLFAITMGSKVGRLNGLNVWLGFAPQVVQGQPCFHALDIEKTLQPLAEVTVVAAVTRTIVLDPGHGGADAGTRAPRGEREKDYTLDWALRTERLLTNAGWRVILTRRADVDVPLPERVAIAERSAADLFISLHFNSAAPHAGPAGIETYCLTPVGVPSTLVRGFPDDLRQSHPNNAFDRGNLQLAAKLHRELVLETKALDNGIKRARFMGVLRNQSRPAVLIEGGYLSNPAEFNQINSSKYRERLAEAVVRSLQ
jgi:N-acetylmuramoyl-L-alanine amidase